ncbi:nestin [Tiliqua scincoides]|uniref:nestin n=1 Tax=Tiliqua scincoides TaxID=71010 RepID=UPI0034622AE0
MESLALPGLGLGELNRRLEAYLARVQSLEGEHARLRAQVAHLRRGQAEGEPPSWRARLQGEVEALRARLEAACGEAQRAGLDRDGLREEAERLSRRCLQERAAQEEARRALAEGKRALEEERRAQIWLRERGAQLESEREALREAHREEVAALQLQRGRPCLLERPLPPRALPPQQPPELDGLARGLAQLCSGALEGYRAEVARLQGALDRARGQLRDATEDARQDQLRLQQLQRELAGLQARKGVLEEGVARLWQRQQGDGEKVQLAIEALEEEKRVLRTQIAQVLEDQQQLMQLKMSLSLEVATYRSLLEAESTRLQVPTTDYRMISGLWDAKLETSQSKLHMVSLDGPRDLKLSPFPKPRLAKNHQDSPVISLASVLPTACEFQNADPALQLPPMNGFDEASPDQEVLPFVAEAPQVEVASQVSFHESPLTFGPVSPEATSPVKEESFLRLEPELQEDGGEAGGPVGEEEEEEPREEPPGEAPIPSMPYPTQLVTEALEVALQEMNGEDPQLGSGLLHVPETPKSIPLPEEEENGAAVPPSAGPEEEAVPERLQKASPKDYHLTERLEVVGEAVVLNGGQVACAERQELGADVWVSQGTDLALPQETELLEEERGLIASESQEDLVSGKMDSGKEMRPLEEEKQVQKEEQVSALQTSWQLSALQETSEHADPAALPGQEAAVLPWDGEASRGSGPSHLPYEEQLQVAGADLEESDGGVDDLEVVSTEALHLSEEDEERRELWSPSRDIETGDLQAEVSEGLATEQTLAVSAESQPEPLFLGVEQEAPLCKLDSASPDGQEEVVEPLAMSKEEEAILEQEVSLCKPNSASLEEEDGQEEVMEPPAVSREEAILEQEVSLCKPNSASLVEEDGQEEVMEPPAVSREEAILEQEVSLCKPNSASLEEEDGQEEVMEPPAVSREEAILEQEVSLCKPNSASLEEEDGQEKVVEPPAVSREEAILEQEVSLCKPNSASLEEEDGQEEVVEPPAVSREEAILEQEVSLCKPNSDSLEEEDGQEEVMEPPAVSREEAILEQEVSLCKPNSASLEEEDGQEEVVEPPAVSREEAILEQEVSLCKPNSDSLEEEDGQEEVMEPPAVSREEAILEQEVSLCKPNSASLEEEDGQEKVVEPPAVSREEAILEQEVSLCKPSSDSLEEEDGQEEVMEPPAMSKEEAILEQEVSLCKPNSDSLEEEDGQEEVMEPPAVSREEAILEQEVSLCKPNSDSLEEEDGQEEVVEPPAVSREEEAILRDGASAGAEGSFTLAGQPRSPGSTDDVEGLGEDVLGNQISHEDESMLDGEDVVDKEGVSDEEAVGVQGGTASVLPPENIPELEASEGGQKEDPREAPEGEQKAEEGGEVGADSGVHKEEWGTNAETTETGSGEEAGDGMDRGRAESWQEQESSLENTAPKPESSTDAGLAEAEETEGDAAVCGQDPTPLVQSVVGEPDPSAEVLSEGQGDAALEPQDEGQGCPQAPTEAFPVGSLPSPSSDSASEDSLESVDTSPNAPRGTDRIERDLERGRQIVLEDTLPDHTPLRMYDGRAAAGEGRSPSESEEAADLPLLAEDGSALFQDTEQGDPRSPQAEESGKEQAAGAVDGSGGEGEEGGCGEEPAASQALPGAEEPPVPRDFELSGRDGDLPVIGPEMPREEEVEVERSQEPGELPETRGEQEAGSVDVAGEPEKESVFQAGELDLIQGGGWEEKDTPLGCCDAVSQEAEGAPKVSPLTSVADLGEVVLDGELLPEVQKESQEAVFYQEEEEEEGLLPVHESQPISELESCDGATQLREPTAEAGPDPSPEAALSVLKDGMKDSDILEIVEQALEFNQEVIKAAGQCMEKPVPEEGAHHSPEEEEVPPAMSPSIEESQSFTDPSQASSPRAKDPPEPTQSWTESDANGLPPDPLSADFPAEILNGVEELPLGTAAIEDGLSREEPAKKVSFTQQCLEGEAAELSSLGDPALSPPTSDEALGSGEGDSEEVSIGHEGPEAPDADICSTDLLQPAGVKGKGAELEVVPLSAHFGEEILCLESRQPLKYGPEDSPELWFGEGN